MTLLESFPAVVVVGVRICVVLQHYSFQHEGTFDRPSSLKIEKPEHPLPKNFWQVSIDDTKVSAPCPCDADVRGPCDEELLDNVAVTGREGTMTWVPSPIMRRLSVLDASFEIKTFTRRTIHTWGPQVIMPSTGKWRSLSQRSRRAKIASHRLGKYDCCHRTFSATIPC